MVKRLWAPSNICRTVLSSTASLKENIYSRYVWGANANVLKLFSFRLVLWVSTPLRISWVFRRIKWACSVLGQVYAVTTNRIAGYLFPLSTGLSSAERRRKKEELCTKCVCVSLPGLNAPYMLPISEHCRMPDCCSGLFKVVSQAWMRLHC